MARCGVRTRACEAPTDDTLVIVAGFSCRHQIAHGTGRRALHAAEVLRMGLRDRRGLAP